MFIIYDDFYLKHYNGPGHPENAGRLTAIKKVLENRAVKNKIALKKPGAAALKEIEMIHDTDYINEIKNLSKSGGISYLDPDTAVTEHTYDCALLAAGGCFTGIDLIFNKKSEFSKFFAVVRPPGHHAFRNRGSGFCIFNNIALSVRYAQKKYNIKKAAIIDFDAHHGNGTQDLFYKDKNVFYISFHQYPHYPGTGNFDETGSGGGEGFNLNFPFEPQTGESDYLIAIMDIVVPIMEKFRPDLFLVSAGYDSHLEDSLSSLQLVENSYYKIMYIISYLSYRYSSSRLGAVLEGGYNHESTAYSVLKTIQGSLSGEEFSGIKNIEELENKLKEKEDFRLREIKNGLVLKEIKQIFGI